MWLLRVMRGEPIRQMRLITEVDPVHGVVTDRRWVEEDHYPSFEERLDAANKCANYFAPKLATHVIQTAPPDVNDFLPAFQALAGKLPV